MTTALVKPLPATDAAHPTAFREVLLRIESAYRFVGAALEQKAFHGPAATRSRPFMMLELRRLRSLFFVPPGLYAHGAAQGESDARAESVDAAIEFFETYAKHNTLFLEYLFTLNETIAVRAWTVLEATAARLWTDALDLHRKPAVRIWTAMHAPKKTQPPGKKKGAQVPTSKAPPPNIGSTLANGVGFSNPGSLADRFQLFDASLAKELRESTPLKRLNAARHIIVHRAGVIDKQFIEQTGLDVQEDTRLGPRFSHVADWTEAAIFFALRCFEVVDAWEHDVAPKSVVRWPPFFR